MNTYELSDEEIIDLIFEKKIRVKNISISSKHSFLTILAKLDQRLKEENIVETEQPIFSTHNDKSDVDTTEDDQLIMQRTKKIYSAA